MAQRDYLIGEIAQDAVEGLITRRDALRRLGLLGVGLAAAATLLAACGDDEPAASSTTAVPTTGPVTPSGQGETITFTGPGGELTAAWAEAAEPKGAVLVMHENRGLTPHFQELVGRFAADGYSALCVDLATVAGGLEGASDADVLAALKAGLDELVRRTGAAKVGAVGFCFGGGTAWQLIQDGDDRLAAVAPFYGTPPEPADFSASEAEVLAVYGELDARVNATQDGATAALEAAGLTHTVKVFPGADHAFFNDTGPRYDPAAATTAYRLLLDLFARTLA